MAAAGVTLAGTLAMSLPAPSASAARALVEAPRFVALGDSYAAGPLTGAQAGGPSGCLRSERDYPAVAAAALGMDLTDVSCVGATTGNLTSPEPTHSGNNPPQIDAVTRRTAVVSLTIGGNDVGFTGILEHCVAATPWGPTRDGRTCEQGYVVGGSDRLAARVAATGRRVGTLLAEIHHRAPAARVFVVGYPDLLPPVGAGCWPRVPLTRADVPYLRGVEESLNRTLQRDAARHGATYVDTYTPTEAHNACADGSGRWVQPLVPTSAALPFHPDRAGEAAMSEALVAAVNRGLMVR
jgi:lysophospholipase L1-like esterase